MLDFTLQQTGAELQDLINKIAPTEEQVTQLTLAVENIESNKASKEDVAHAIAEAVTNALNTEI